MNEIEEPLDIHIKIHPLKVRTKDVMPGTIVVATSTSKGLFEHTLTVNVMQGHSVDLAALDLIRSMRKVIRAKERIDEGN